jgi:putative inorganic carbon (HCO3(-)) transporter
VIAFAALTGPVPKLGVIAVALLAAGVMLTREDGPRAWAMLGALLLAPALLLADVWHSPQLSIIHRQPLEAAIVGAVVVGALGAVATLIARRPWLIAPLAAATLPFRIPISIGSSTSNLLVPLYFVIAAGCLAWIVPALRRRRPVPAPSRHRAGAGPAIAGPGEDGVRGRSAFAPHRFEQILGGYLVLYALQAIYSADFEKALQNMVFFYVPFALMLARLRDLRWDRELLHVCLRSRRRPRRCC